ncbi:MAG: hypothetical protein OEZ47_05310 [Gammaproteobacteria bacterium]|nr:hypothetical protein [Gammaproteobacteria bacterium]
MGGKWNWISRLLIAASLSLVATASHSDPNLKILSPEDGATFKKGESIAVKYDIKPDRGGDHSHIYVDHKEAGILRRKKATFTLSPLPEGEHSICLKVVNKAHAPIGQETCIMVTRK